MPNWTRVAIESWTERAGLGEDRVFRSLRKGAVSLLARK
jgi:hypothetical protein